MILYMVGKLTPNSSYLTRRLVQSVSGRGYFRTVPSQNGDKIITSPPPPQSLNGSRGGRYGDFNLLRAAITTKKVEMFQAVMTTISDKLTEEEVRRCTLVEVAY